MYNMGFNSLNSIRNLHPADLIFSLAVFYTAIKQNRKPDVEHLSRTYERKHRRRNNNE